MEAQGWHADQGALHRLARKVRGEGADYFEVFAEDVTEKCAAGAPAPHGPKNGSGGPPVWRNRARFQ